jgi:hypothetical protein
MVKESGKKSAAYVERFQIALDDAKDFKQKNPNAVIATGMEDWRGGRFVISVKIGDVNVCWGSLSETRDWILGMDGALFFKPLDDSDGTFACGKTIAETIANAKVWAEQLAQAVLSRQVALVHINV